MPLAAYQECRYPRCPNYAVHRGYCATHVGEATNRRWDGPGNLNPNNKRFRWMRAAFLQRNPICNHCGTEAATVLDHITPHRGVSALFWSQRNWQGLCVHCHGVKTARETLAVTWG